MEINKIKAYFAVPTCLRGQCSQAMAPGRAPRTRYCENNAVNPRHTTDLGVFYLVPVYPNLGSLLKDWV